MQIQSTKIKRSRLTRAIGTNRIGAEAAAAAWWNLGKALGMEAAGDDGEVTHRMKPKTF